MPFATTAHLASAPRAVLAGSTAAMPPLSVPPRREASHQSQCSSHDSHEQEDAWGMCSLLFRDPSFMRTLKVQL